MSNQRKITELVGRVVEMKDDNKRYLVMPFELRSDDFRDIIGTIEGKISSQDLVYKNTVVIMPLDESPEKRKRLHSNTVEGTHFTVKNIKPEETERVKLLNKLMSEVLNNTKQLYRNLTELKKLEEKQAELELKIKKLKDTNSEPLSKWARPAEKAYLLEMYRDEIKVLNARERLNDENRPLYKTSLTSPSNATKIEVLELLKVTDKPIYYRYGLSYRGAKAKPITREKAVDIWANGGPNGGFMDMDEYKDKIELNEYSSNDMW